MLNTDIAYLLGMIVGKGEIIRGNEKTKIIINIPHKSLIMEDKNTQTSIKASLLDITNRLKPLTDTDLISDTSNLNVAILSFSKNNGSYLIRDINAYLRGINSWRQARIPDEILENSSEDVKKEFLRGLADVTIHIRSTNNAYGKPYNHRIYIEVMDNYELVIDLANLLKSLDIPVQDIRWGHPNFVDPEGHMYRKNNRHYKEHQIKIYAEEFEKIGFSIEHKNELLKKLSKTNKQEWKSAKPIEGSHHKYYWQTKNRSKLKISHPDENHPKIHPKIRGKHFDSWKEIARELGYHE